MIKNAAILLVRPFVLISALNQILRERLCGVFELNHLLVELVDHLKTRKEISKLKQKAKKERKKRQRIVRGTKGKGKTRKRGEKKEKGKKSTIKKRKRKRKRK